VDPTPSEHVDQGVDTEEIDLAPDKVADARLCDAEQFGSIGLGQAAALDQLSDRDHE
jgi:hypothetical protein